MNLPAAPRLPALMLAAGATAAAIALTAASSAAVVSAFVILCGAAVYARRLGRYAMAYLVLGVVVATVQTVRLAPAPLPASAEGRKMLYSARVEALTANSSLIVEADSIDGRPCRPFLCRLALTGGSDGVAEGATVRFRAELLPAGRCSGIADLRTRHWSELGRRLSAQGAVPANAMHLTGRQESLATRCADIRRAIERAAYASGLDRSTASLLIASCFGATDSEVPVRETFRAAGIAHLLCVSGFHVGIVAAMLALLLWPLRLWARVGRMRYALLIAAVWLYVVVTGSQPPAIRAGIMITVYMLGHLVQTPTRPLNSLFLAAGIMLCVNPFWLYSAGFQLSLSAVAGLIVFMPRLNPVPGRYARLHRAVDVLIVPVAAILGSAPVLLLWFKALPLASLPVSIVVSAIFPAFMAAGMALTLLSALGWHLPWAARGLDTWCDIMEKACDKAYGLPFSATDALDLSPYAPAVVAVAVVLFAAALYSQRKALKISLATLALAVFIVALIPYEPQPRIVATADTFGPHLNIGLPYAALASDTAAGRVQVLLFDRRCRLDPDSVIAARQPAVVVIDICPEARTRAIVDACRRRAIPHHLLRRHAYAGDLAL